ncbi:MAG: hypothetical protein J0G96_07275 [Flavobacteriia bacterium]|nr:hypothetical protein [Flavobacteriia bacterium]OJX36668.1 MAG: hypothetical protein BGO87_12790 [Flavobacteriia bacterium 40-80]
MEQLKIQIPEGFQVDSFNTESGVIKFKPKSLPLVGRIKTFEEVCKEMSQDPKDYEITSDNPRIAARQALDRVLLICELFQKEAEELDPNNTNQRKWFPWFDLEISPANPSGFRFLGSDYSNAHTRSVLGPLLWLPSEEVTDYVGRTFEGEFKNVIILKKK